MKENQIQQNDWNNLWSGVAYSLGLPHVVHSVTSLQGKINHSKLIGKERTRGNTRMLNLQLKIINRLKYLDSTRPCFVLCVRVCNVSKRLMLHFPFWRLHWCPFNDPVVCPALKKCRTASLSIFTHQHWASTGVLHDGSINTDSYHHAQQEKRA